MKKKNFKTKLVSLLAAAVMLVGMLPSQAAQAEAYDVSITNPTSCDEKANVTITPTTNYLDVKAFGQTAIDNGAYIEFSIFAEEEGLYNIDWKSSLMAGTQYVSPIKLTVNGEEVEYTLGTAKDETHADYLALVNLNAGENKLRFTLTALKGNGSEGLFHLYYINCKKNDSTALRFEGEGKGATRAGGGWLNATTFYQNVTQEKADLAAGNIYWEQTVPVDAGNYTLTWRTTNLAGTKYVSPATLTVNGTAVTSYKTKTADSDPWYIYTADVKLTGNDDKIRFTINSTKNYGAASAALFYIDYIELEYVDSGKYNGSLKFEDTAGTGGDVKSVAEASGGKLTYVFGTGTSWKYTLNVPAGDYNVYFGAGEAITNSYLGQMGFKIDDAAYDIDSTTVTTLTGKYAINTVEMKYNTAITLTGNETITVSCTAKAPSGSNNYIEFDYIELVPVNAQIGDAVIKVDSNKVAAGETLQAASKLYYSNGYECSSYDITSVEYASSNTNAATVDENGLITAVNPGVTTITVTYNDTYTASTNISVYDESGIIPVVSSYDGTKATIKLTRITEGTGTAAVIIGAYAEENGVKTSFEDVQLEAEVNPERGRVAKVAKTIDGDNICAFIWDSISGMKPITDVIDLK